MITENASDGLEIVLGCSRFAGEDDGTSAIRDPRRVACTRGDEEKSM